MERGKIEASTHVRTRRALSRKELMFEVTVEDTFAAGHYLRNYKGKCENPHGHNYKVRVTLAGKELDKAGLLLDFKDLREVMRHVTDRLDHQMINDLEPFKVTQSFGGEPGQVFLRRIQHSLAGSDEWARAYSQRNCLRN